MFRKILNKYLIMLTMISLIIPSTLLNLVNLDKAYAANTDVIINEMMVNSTQEWIELYNSSNTDTIDVSGWYFTSIDYAGSLYTIPASTTITPNGFLKLDLVGNKLRNDADDVTLLDSAGNTNPANQITYGPNPWTQIVAAPGVDKTIGRVDDSSGCWYSNLAPSENASNQAANPVLPVSINSLNIKATTNNPANFINNTTKLAVKVEAELSSYQNSTLTAYLVDESGNKVNDTITATADQTHQEFTLNTNTPITLVDGTVVPWIKITDISTGISTEYLEGTYGEKDIIAPDAPTAASVGASSNNDANIINSYSKSAVAASVTLGANSLATDNVMLEFAGSLSYNRAGTEGAGTVNYTGLDLQSLADGNVVLTAFVTDVAGNKSSTLTGTQATKDTVIQPSTISMTDSSFGPLSWLDQVSGTASDATSGVDGVAASVQRNSDNKYFNGVSWQTDEYLLSTTYSSGNWFFYLSSSLLDTGVTYTVKSYAVDNAGNTQATATTKTFTYDTSVPNGAFSINDGAVYTTINTVTLKITASADATKMQFSNDNTTWSTWENLTSTKSWTLSTGDGNKTVYARFKNAAGNESAKVSNIITFDSTTPTGTVSINAGATYATSKTVTLSIAGTDLTSGMDKMQFSNDPSRAWSDWEAFNTTKTWTLSDTDGTKTVYVKLKDKAGNVTSTEISDSIVLDSTLPTVNAGADQIKNAQFTQTGSASDTNGVASYAWTKVSGPGTITFGSANLASTTISASVDGTYVIRLTATDNAGNVASDDFTLSWDTTSPIGTISINNNANYTKSTNITLSISATDANTVSLMTLSTNGVDFTAWENYATTKSLTLPIGDGTKNVYVKFKDIVGNIGLIYSDSIILDTTVPPDPAIGSSPDGQTITKGNSFTVSGTSEANAQITINIYSDALITGYTTADNSGNWSYTVSSDNLDKLGAGDHKITVIVTDSAGNTSSEKQIAQFALKDKEVAATETVNSTSTPTPTESVSPQDETEVTTVGPDTGEIKGNDTESSTTSKNRIMVTLLILIIAAGAAFGGYYGYEWWQNKDKKTKKTIKREKENKEEKIGRW